MLHGARPFVAREDVLREIFPAKGGGAQSREGQQNAATPPADTLAKPIAQKADREFESFAQEIHAMPLFRRDPTHGAVVVRIG